MFKLASSVVLVYILSSVIAAPAPDTPLPFIPGGPIIPATSTLLYNPGGPISTTSPPSRRVPTTTIICPT
ncbi:hypothetical protein PUNSTDRAFT_128805 [Punctularia strigosozonata HHB-11173 SS5]|uniref:uncharacterized protein n=1 Tax=Punctularia strigosozonata (strain HHB-11173) TaxID=741275 RepID=UPI0004417961|nr:uncharacterized protein PUNSTDRAFT_128805 [Punctularia strigosozonata HHB-11173 SS5]EIN13121.1 hypothetical protein PUNSTDRAFT_128805 [Punctularia strigosozonata HHB-11173 SS5]